MLIVQSCINTFDWSKESGLEKQLIMNSYIYTDESVHTIYMALSDGFYLRELPQKAEIECFINGVPVCKSDSMEYYKYIPRKYVYTCYCCGNTIESIESPFYIQNPNAVKSWVQICNNCYNRFYYNFEKEKDY